MSNFLLAGFVFLACNLAGAQPAGISLKVLGEPQPIFRWATDKCDPDDIPDATPSAFRDANGLIHLFSTTMVNRAMVGKSFDRLKRDCRPVYEASNNDDPFQFDDKGWLTSFHTADGRTVYALVHNEFHGHTRPWLCPSGKYGSCWYNSIVLARSEDGGRSFQRAGTGAQALVLAPPAQYIPDAGTRIGPSTPSNIVNYKGYHYILFVSEGGRVCVARSKDIGDPHSWRLWDGRSFRIESRNPYSRAIGSSNEQCVHLKGLAPGSAGSVVWHPRSQKFVLVQIAGPSPAGDRTPGIYYAVSEDMINWTKPALLWPVPARVSRPQTCQTPHVYSYPALIDPASPSRNFDVSGDHPWLLVVRRRFKNCSGTMDRDLLRVQAEIQDAQKLPKMPSR